MKVKCLLFTLLALIVLLATPTTVLAHLPNQPPFLKINGQYAPLYPVLSTSLQDFPLPQDIAPQNYLVDQVIKFELDATKLPASPDVIKRTVFSWEFGDGTKAEGLSTTHAYKKMGSYILHIYTTESSNPEPQLLESVMVHVLPDPSYQLPKVVIKINSQQSKDPLTDIILLSFAKQITFDGSSSTAKSSRITEYTWDFGDSVSAQGANQTHTYNTELAQVFPLLRIKDANGFISDNFVQISNKDNPDVAAGAVSTPTPKVAMRKNSSSYYVVVAVVAAFVVWWLASKRGKKRR